MPLNQQYLQDNFRYDPLNGGLYRTTGNFRGKRYGSLSPDGYRKGMACKVRALEHRLVWMYHYNEVPIGDLDHINRDRSDNRIENLRVLTRSQNTRNSNRIDNARGFYWESRVVAGKEYNYWVVSLPSKATLRTKCMLQARAEALRIRKHHSLSMLL